MKQKVITIKSKHMYKVVETLRIVLPYAKRPVDMFDGSIDKDTHKCNTSQCFGGWYAIARTWDVKKKRHALHSETTDRMNYTTGVRLMAEDLHLPEEKTRDYRNYWLERWARRNPEIWGNAEGGGLFQNPKAFGKESTFSLTLEHICNHLEGVADRIYLLELFNKTGEK